MACFAPLPFFIGLGPLVVCPLERSDDQTVGFTFPVQSDQNNFCGCVLSAIDWRVDALSFFRTWCFSIHIVSLFCPPLHPKWIQSNVVIYHPCHLTPDNFGSHLKRFRGVLLGEGSIRVVFGVWTP